MAEPTTRDQLLMEAATILEQEGWLLVRMSHDPALSSRRLRLFAERYEAWYEQVKAARERDFDMWPAPPDNS